MTEVGGRLGGALAHPVSVPVEGGQQAVVHDGRPVGRSGERQGAQDVGSGRDLGGLDRPDQRHGGVGVVEQALLVGEDGGGQRPHRVEVAGGGEVGRQRVEVAALGEGIIVESTGWVGLAAQCTDRLPVGSHRCGHVVVAGPGGQGERRFDLVGELLHGGCALEVEAHGHVAGVRGVVDPSDAQQVLPGPPGLRDIGFQGVEPGAGAQGIQITVVGEVVAERLCCCQNPAGRLMTRPVVLADRDGGERGSHQRPDQSRRRTTAGPHPGGLGDQPSGDRDAGEERRRDGPVDHPGHRAEPGVLVRPAANVVDFAAGAHPGRERVDAALQTFETARNLPDHGKGGHANRQHREKHQQVKIQACGAEAERYAGDQETAVSQSHARQSVASPVAKTQWMQAFRAGQRKRATYAGNDRPILRKESDIGLKSCRQSLQRILLF